MRTRLALLLLALALGGCRYTFWPLIPQEEVYPERVSISGELQESDGAVTARLLVRRWPEANYLELRWYLEDKLVDERSIWLEKAKALTLQFPYHDQAAARLLVMVEGRPLLQLDLGNPSLPPPPTSPNPEPKAE